jgi:uncharacterized protein YbjT (DUF2867 family)
MQKTALIAGASGLIGSHLLPLLLASDRYAKVIAVGRRLVPVVHPKLEQRVLDFDHLEDHDMALIADDVYCCLGTTMRQAGSKDAFYRVDYLYVVKLAALSAGNFAAQLLVVSTCFVPRCCSASGARRAPVSGWARRCWGCCAPCCWVRCVSTARSWPPRWLRPCSGPPRPMA